LLATGGFYKKFSSAVAKCRCCVKVRSRSKIKFTFPLPSGCGCCRREETAPERKIFSRGGYEKLKNGI
jgi:hypothetical protein